MKHTQRPIAYVDESGYVVPNPTFTESSMRYMKGRYIYTQTELKHAIEDMNRRQDERRRLADKHYGGDAVQTPAEFEVIEEVTEVMDGHRETVPSLTAAPTRPRKTEGKSRKLMMPNEAELPETLHEEPKNVNLTEEEREDLQGIDVNAAVAAMFGAKG